MIAQAVLEDNETRLYGRAGAISTILKNRGFLDSDVKERRIGNDLLCVIYNMASAPCALKGKNEVKIIFPAKLIKKYV